MPTYSLTLREPLGRKLTIGEVDNNWLYLQDLASQSGGVNIDDTQIGFGSTSGLTSSSQFIFDSVNNNLILGFSHSITGTTSYSIILGGRQNTFYNNDLLQGGYDIKSYSTIIGGLGNEISKLNDLIERLKTVNQLLDLKSAINLNEQQLADLSNAFLPTGGDFGIYKGFKFAIKEEQTLGAQQAIVVKGNKRRYAVAINRDGTDILRSELSFTLDPNDLIDQLKLIIDQRNLQG